MLNAAHWQLTNPTLAQVERHNGPWLTKIPKGFMGQPMWPRLDVVNFECARGAWEIRSSRCQDVPDDWFGAPCSGVDAPGAHPTDCVAFCAIEFDERGCPRSIAVPP